MSKHKQISSSKNEMDKYEVLKLLGEGSFGRVYKAKVVADSSFVALKVICKARRSSKEIVGLRRECEIQRNLHHPNIIEMLDSFETPNEIVVVTEFAQKELNNLLGKEGYLSEKRAGPIVWDLVSALYYLHSHRVLHRDLKPQNILIDAKNRAKLCDFGFARNMSTGTHVLTSIKGTPLYMAPELIEEQPYDYKADLWSLGCIMYELLVGAPPFCTASILHLIRLIRHEQIQWPTFVSDSCIGFLKGLLQKDPAKRIGWVDILEHEFVKGHILMGEEAGSKPLTGALSEKTLHEKEEQKRERLGQQTENRSPSHPIETTAQDTKNNNVSLNEAISKMSLEETQQSSMRSTVDSRTTTNFIEETNPIETEEWIVFLQKTMEEVIYGDLTSLTQPQLANIVVAPLRNISTSPKVLTYAAQLLSLPLVVRGVSEDAKTKIQSVYLEVKLVPNLVYSSKQIMKLKSDDSAAAGWTPSPVDAHKDAADLTDEDLQALEHIYMLITHLVHLDKEFLVQLCDAFAVLNVSGVLRTLLFCKKRVQIPADLLAVLTAVLRQFPENAELIEKILLSGAGVKLVELLRCNNPLMQERSCLFLLYLGKYLNGMESVWDETVRETLEALMYDSNESVRNAADKAVDELKYKDFYKQKSAVTSPRSHD